MKRIIALSSRNIWILIVAICWLLMQGCSHTHIEDVRMMGYIFKPLMICNLSDGQFSLFQQMEKYGHIQTYHFSAPPHEPRGTGMFSLFLFP